MDAGYWPFHSLIFVSLPLTHKLGDELPWLSDNSRINVFWRTLYAAGFRANGSIEPLSLLKRGN